MFLKFSVLIEIFLALVSTINFQKSKEYYDSRIMLKKKINNDQQENYLRKANASAKKLLCTAVGKLIILKVFVRSDVEITILH